MTYTTHVLSPKDFQLHIEENKSHYSYLQTSGGFIRLASTQKGIYQTSFVKTCEKISVTSNINTNVLLLSGTQFQVQVWQAALKIPAGQTVSYHDLACALGQPKAYRAVANALGKNKLAYLIPCHRIIRKNGSLGGFAWGIEVKKALLEFEKNSNNF
ncbi:MGMT family protein [Candidatus Dependentiae bacterium]|nr:MGMT family protein [Candidatus Dependentiae bacterium]